MATPEDLANPESRAAKTRSRILDAAALELRDKGFAGTRLTNISKTVDIKAGAIYYYFYSIVEIIEEVIELGQRSVIDHVLAALEQLPSDASATDKIIAATRAHLTTTLTESLYASASMRNLDQLPDPMRERQTLLRREYGAIWRELFEEGIRRGELDPGLDPHSTRMFLLGALNWTLEWWDDSRGSLDDILQAAERFVRNALGSSATVGK